MSVLSNESLESIHQNSSLPTNIIMVIFFLKKIIYVLILKLKTFFDKTITYQGKLNSIYNKYTGSYNTIATYSGCTDYSIGCFSNGPSARRSQALINLENNKLDEEYSKLNKMLEQAATGYDVSTLNNAINKYKEVIKKAKEAENKIEKESDYPETKKADAEKKKRNLDNLKTVKDVLTVSKKT